MNAIETAKELMKGINGIAVKNRNCMILRDFAKAQWQDELDFLNGLRFWKDFSDIYKRIKILEEALKILGTNGGDD